jgi:hypothetical protein
MTKEKRENKYMYIQSPEAVNSNVMTYSNGSEIAVYRETAKTAQFSRTDNFFSRCCFINSLLYLSGLLVA